LNSTHPEIPNHDYESNIALTYEYLEKSITAAKSNIDSINTRLGLLIGFSATLIRFSSGLPDKLSVDFYSLKGELLGCNSCLLLQVLCCIFLVISIIVSLWGLSPITVKTNLTPQQLLENAGLASKNDYKLAIIHFWEKILPKIMEVVEKKSSRLRCAIVLFGIAASLSALDIIIASISKY
jgi:hypothetical protein